MTCVVSRKIKLFFKLPIKEAAKSSNTLELLTGYIKQPRYTYTETMAKSDTCDMLNFNCCVM